MAATYSIQGLLLGGLPIPVNAITNATGGYVTNASGGYITYDISSAVPVNAIKNSSGGYVLNSAGNYILFP